SLKRIPSMRKSVWLELEPRVKSEVTPPAWPVVAVGRPGTEPRAESNVGCWRTARSEALMMSADEASSANETGVRVADTITRSSCRGASVAAAEAEAASCAPVSATWARSAKDAASAQTRKDRPARRGRVEECMDFCLSGGLARAGILPRGFGCRLLSRFILR